MPYNTDMDNQANPQPSASPSPSDEQNRRELVTKLGKFAAYAAPFTVMALNSKAASGSGAAPTPASRRGAGR